MIISCTRGESYEYHQGAVDLFSVSQVRKMAHDTYAGIPLEVLEPARKRGEILHRRFWKLLASRAGLMEKPLVIPEFDGYCRSMDDWAERNQVIPVKLEEVSACLKLGFAGTPDALVRMGRRQRLTLLDLKTGALTLTDPMQLIAYKHMQGYEEADDLLDLYIQPDSSHAKEKPVTPAMKATEWSWFLTALNLLKARRNHGVK